jgi:hypothetical protein
VNWTARRPLGRSPSPQTPPTTPPPKAVYDIDASAPLRASHNNPEVAELYKTALDAPNSARAHALLHTRYAPRPKHG